MGVPFFLFFYILLQGPGKLISADRIIAKSLPVRVVRFTLLGELCTVLYCAILYCICSPLRLHTPTLLSDVSGYDPELHNESLLKRCFIA